MSPRTIAVVAAVLLSTLAVVVVAGVVSDREAALPDAVRVEEVPSAYRIVYEVRAAAGPERPDTMTTEVLQVARPFRSLVTTLDGDRLVSGRVSGLTTLFQHTDGRWIELRVPPAMAASDLRLDRVLDDLVVAGEVERVDEVRRIAGRACQVHRLGGPVDGGTLTPLDDVDGEVAEVCVDEAGLVLAEEWRQDGDLLRRRVAVDVDLDPDFDDDTFTVEDAEPVAAAEGGGAATRVDDDEPFGDRTFSPAEVPPGFDHVGRWSVVRPRIETQVDPLAPPTEGRIAGIATVWVRGVDALVVEQGGISGGGAPFRPHPRGRRVDVADLGAGEVITDGRGTEIRVVGDDGSFVRVWSTLPRDEVVELARSLRPS